MNECQVVPFPKLKRRYVFTVTLNEWMDLLFQGNRIYRQIDLEIDIGVCSMSIAKRKAIKLAEGRGYKNLKWAGTSLEGEYQVPPVEPESYNDAG